MNSSGGVSSTTVTVTEQRTAVVQKTALTGGDGYTVASCFATPLQRLDVAQLPSYWNYDESTGNCVGITDRGALYTFEEFIEESDQPAASPRCALENVNGGDDSTKVQPTTANLADISATLTDEMLNMDTVHPVASSAPAQMDKKQEKDTHKQQQQYKEEPTVFVKSTSGVQQFKIFSRSNKRSATYETGPSPASTSDFEAAPDGSSFQDNTSSTLFRRAFCPTIRNNIYGVQCSGDDESVYAYYSSGENLKHSNNGSSTYPKFSFQRAFSDITDDPASSSTSANPTAAIAAAAICADGNGDNAAPCPSNQPTRHCAESLLTKIMCCFRATTSIASGVRRHRRYDVTVRDSASGHNSGSNNNLGLNQAAVVEQPGKYSWDRARANVINDDICHIRNCSNQVLIRTPGQTAGQQLTVENCTKCIIVVLDSSASVNIDDCRECLIVLGPCKGSIFIRDCSHCSLYAICQQFRTRDCRRLQVRLFCATAPTIEDSSIEFGPLTICYSRIEEHMADAELSPLVNRWYRVHNFTPESGNFSLIDTNADVNEDDENLTSGFPLNDKFCREFLMNQQLNSLNLTLRRSASFLFCVPHGDESALMPGEDRVLLLIKSFDKKVNVKNDQELYHDVRRLMKRLFTVDENNAQRLRDIRLLGIYDVTLKAGEFENLLHLKPSKSPEGKLVALEMAGEATIVRHFCTQILASVGNPPTIEIIDPEKTSFAIHQISRFSETQDLI